MRANGDVAARELSIWLSRRLDPEKAGWIENAAAQATSQDGAGLERLLALAGRKAGRENLAPDAGELARAAQIRPDWTPRAWTLADAARTAILLPLTHDADAFGETLKALCRTADLATLIGLYRAIPLFPQSEALDWQIGEGLRTSVRSVFEAIAHDSPVPAERFSDHRWNHMVLKALFIDSTLQPIVGLDTRRNQELSATLLDHVRERRAAGRAVDLQVWRCIAPFSGPQELEAIAPLMDSTDRNERLAAALFLTESPDPQANALFDSLTPEREAIAKGANWSALA